MSAGEARPAATGETRSAATGTEAGTAAGEARPVATDGAAGAEAGDARPVVWHVPGTAAGETRSAATGPEAGTAAATVGAAGWHAPGTAAGEARPVATGGAAGAEARAFGSVQPFRLQRTELPDGFTVAAAVGGAGDPLVYLPGFPDVFSVSAEPMEFHQALATRWRVHAVAPPGAVGDPEAGLSSIRTVDDLIFRYRWWAEAAGLGRVRLVGHSWGAWLALELASWFPELVSDLVLLCPLGLDLPDRQLPDVFRLSQPADGFRRADLRRLLFAGERSPAALALFPDTPLAAEEEMRRIRVLRFMALIGWQPAFFYDRDLPSRARRFRGRSLIVSGGRDAFAGPAYGKALGRLLGGQHAVIEDCGHAAVVEAPRVLADRVLAFLAGGGGGGADAGGGARVPGGTVGGGADTGGTVAGGRASARGGAHRAGPPEAGEAGRDA